MTYFAYIHAEQEDARVRTAASLNKKKAMQQACQKAWKKVEKDHAVLLASMSDSKRAEWQKKLSMEVENQWEMTRDAPEF